MTVDPVASPSAAEAGVPRHRALDRMMLLPALASGIAVARVDARPERSRRGVAALRLVVLVLVALLSTGARLQAQQRDTLRAPVATHATARSARRQASARRAARVRDDHLAAERDAARRLQEHRDAERRADERRAAQRRLERRDAERRADARVAARREAARRDADRTREHRRGGS